MHTDEAVHADKFRDLLERGTYIYKRHEYHGPTLNYFTLVSSVFSSTRHYTDVTETTLRSVPVAFGVLTVGLTLLLADGLGRRAAAIAALLAAVSPAMVFYSRYYIQETLLVCFTVGLIGCGYRYVRSHKGVWAVFAGLCLGLMHATKETLVIAIGAMMVALIFPYMGRRIQGRDRIPDQAGYKVGHAGLFLLTALVVSALLFSSFLRYPKGIIDSFTAYASYIGRAGGDGTGRVHLHPWYYYFKMLLYSRYAGGPVWSEAIIVLLALVGLIATARPRKAVEGDPVLIAFLGIYTVVLTVVYAVIPYKTPWCMMGFLHGMILMAGVGASALIDASGKLLPRVIVVVFLLAGVSHLAWQAHRANGPFASDSRNPYVYAHTTNDILSVEPRLAEYALAHPAGRAVPIQVVCPGSDYWPLPWYLRSFEKVGWNRTVTDDVIAAPLIIASADLEKELNDRVWAQPFERRHLYLFLFDEPYYIWLRPGVKLIGLVRKDLWDLKHRIPVPASRIPAKEPSK